ncbi:MAG: hypothetical protein MJZ89_04615 [Paludibacteraceae bacterium]|nr:hypothetical protein [Paludibacteraceae bacterium]
MNIFVNILLSVVVSAQIDSTDLWIGDQTAMHLQATASAGEQVSMPLFDQMLQDGLYIVDRSAIDTIAEKDGRVTYKQELMITSFKDSLFYVHPIPFMVNGDTVLSNPLSINIIQPFEMDTTAAITDIKGVMKPKIWWWGILRWVLLALSIAGMATGGYFLYKRLKKDGTDEESIAPELLRPCDEVALEKLEIIKQEKIWQTGEHKLYFTQLTDVVREYIGRRFGISSQEQTSTETLQAMKPILTADDQKELYGKLEKMLQLSDLVKFAKWTPTPDENELSLRSAYALIQEYKDVPAPAENTEKSEHSEEDIL